MRRDDELVRPAVTRSAMRLSSARLCFDKEVEARIPESNAGRPHRETAVRFRLGAHDYRRASMRKREDNLDARAGVSRNVTDRVAARV